MKCVCIHKRNQNIKAITGSKYFCYNYINASSVYAIYQVGISFDKWYKSVERHLCKNRRRVHLKQKVKVIMTVITL